jgi:hypothetical protein
MNSCCENFNKIEFLHALKSIQHEAVTPQAIVKSFHRAGIHPFSPQTVYDRIGVERPKTPEAPPREATLSPLPSQPSTPISVRTLKRAADNVLMTVMPFDVQKQLTPIFKGAVALAHAEALARKSWLSGRMRRKLELHANISLAVFYRLVAL